MMSRRATRSCRSTLGIDRSTTDDAQMTINCLIATVGRAENFFLILGNYFEISKFSSKCGCTSESMTTLFMEFISHTSKETEKLSKNPLHNVRMGSKPIPGT